MAKKDNNGSVLAGGMSEKAMKELKANVKKGGVAGGLKVGQRISTDELATRIGLVKKGAPRPKSRLKDAVQLSEAAVEEFGKAMGAEMSAAIGKTKASPRGVKNLTVEICSELTVEEAMEFLGWEVVEDGFFHLRDENGAKVRLNNCLKIVDGKMQTNRPFRIGLAKRYQSEHLRHEWKLNGQTFIFDWDGICHNGQHSLVGFVLAEQARFLDKKVHKADKVGWKDKCKLLWGHGGKLTCPCIIVKGIDPAVADTLDLGLKRTLGDLFFRDAKFWNGLMLGMGPATSSGLTSSSTPGAAKGGHSVGGVKDQQPAKGKGKAGARKEALAPPPMSEKTRRTLCNILANAARLVWLRAGGRNISDAPHFPHSEAVHFVQDHPKLEEAVLYIWGLEGGTGKGGRKISRFTGALGVAAGVYYLMATSATDPDEFAESGAAALNFDNEAKTKKFWAALAEGTKLEGSDPVYLLREQLPSMPSGSAMERDEKVAMIVKAFNRWMDKLPSKLGDITVKKETKDGRTKLIEAPKLGGLDIEEPERIEEDVTTVEDNREGHMAGKTWAEGDSAWVRVDDGDHWFGVIDEIIDVEDGKNKYKEALLTETDTGKQWQEPLKNLWLKYPGVQ